MTPTSHPQSRPESGLIDDGWNVFGTLLAESFLSSRPRSPGLHPAETRAIRRAGLRGFGRRLLVWLFRPQPMAAGQPPSATDAATRLEIRSLGGLRGPRAPG